MASPGAPPFSFVYNHGLPRVCSATRLPAPARRNGRVVMQRIANPCTSVRFRLAPPLHVVLYGPFRPRRDGTLAECSGRLWLALSHRIRPMAAAPGEIGRAHV